MGARAAFASYCALKQKETTPIIQNTLKVCIAMNEPKTYENVHAAIARITVHRVATCTCVLSFRASLRKIIEYLARKATSISQKMIFYRSNFYEVRISSNSILWCAVFVKLSVKITAWIKADLTRHVLDLATRRAMLHALPDVPCQDTLSSS